MSSNRNRSINALGWSLVIVTPVFILMVIIEVALRLLLPEINILTRIIEPTDDARNYVLKAGKKIIYKGLYETHPPIVWEINQDGLRSDREENFTSDKFRVLTYGDSETFGWAVDIKDSWQRKMENIDPDIQVINFGIPGYNIANIADHMHLTIPEYDPDMLIYFFNKNDYYPAFGFNPTLAKSYAYLAARMIIYRINKDKRKSFRDSRQGAKFIKTNINQMIALSKKHNAPLYVLDMHGKYSAPIREISHIQPEIVKYINIEDTINKFPKADAHLTKPAHAAIAELLCEQISGQSQSKCTPD